MLGADATVNLQSIMVQRVLSAQPESSEKQQHHNLFQTFFAIENRRACVIIDGGSCNNLVSSYEAAPGVLMCEREMCPWAISKYFGD
jgi:hypothetical protein